MSNRAKNIIFSILLLVAVFIVFLYRRSNAPDPIAIEGATMGTTYHITYFDSKARDFKPSVDSLLKVFNQSLNTYLSHSEITTFNNGDSSLKFNLPYFFPVLQRSKEIVTATNGAFDPTVMPLVNAWGFGPGKQFYPDSVQIDSILQFIGFGKIQFNSDSVWKLKPHVQLDFSAIAKGYGVDVVSKFLESKGIENLFVEIGGEVYAKGQNIKEGRMWSVGILDPSSTYEDQKFKAFAILENRALATSGNYFNYREVNGKRYSHTIDPHSGFPVQREILSASVFAPDCMTADAWATACMVAGHDKAIEWVNAQKDIEAFFIFSGPDGSVQTYATPGIKEKIIINPDVK